MKNWLATIFVIVVASVGLLSIPAVMTGCGTPAAKTTQIAGSVTITVDAAMQSWGQWVRANRATVEQRLAVRAGYQKYAASMLVAEKIAVSVLSSPEQQGNYVSALNAASQASVELIALIEQMQKPAQ